MPLSFLSQWREGRIGRRQESAYRSLWSAFSRYPTLADGRHDDVAWREHPGRFACCLIRVPVAELQPQLDNVRAALAGDGKSRLHPDQFLHIMIQEIGFVCRKPTRPDELSIERFDELNSALSTALNDLPAFDVTIANANSFEDAAFLEVHDGGGCEAIHRRLREAAAVTMIPRFAFLPHITIAHYLGSFDALHTVQTLQDFRATEFGKFRVTEVEIATMRVDIDYPPIYTTQKLILGGE
jgi:2'-5' RNA ligase